MLKQKTVLYLSHGGGPMPLLGDSSHQEMVDTLKRIATLIEKPKAILVISAHWEANTPTITSGATPSLIYDYGGFPPESYEIQYPCAGEPELAKSVNESLSVAGIDALRDPHRGFDHGLFVPLKIMYPEADIPCVQLSLDHSLDPRRHIAIGKAIKHLSWDNLLVIGSGFSFHNMRAFFVPGEDESNKKNKAFDQWLRSTMVDKDISEIEREKLLMNWSQAPYAKFCHPREEHLLPLHVCYGLTGRSSDSVFNIKIMNKVSSMFLWNHL